MNKRNDALTEQIRKTFEEKANAYAKRNVSRIIRLHCHPDAIRKSITELKEMSDDSKMKDLFTDISVLVEWALARLPLKRKDESEDPSDQNNMEN